MDAHEYVPLIEETTLRRNRSGYWEIRWTIPVSKSGDGVARTRSQSCSTKSYDLALKVRREYLATLGSASIASAQLLIRDLIDLYVRDHMSVHGTAPTQSESLKAPRKAFGTYEPANLTPALIAAYRNGRVNLGSAAGWSRCVSNGTVRRELGALRAVLNWAQREGHLPRNFVQPHIALPPEGQGRSNTLTEAEEKKLHDACVRVVRLAGAHPSPRTRTALFVLIALNTAARAESIESLTWDRVDLRRKMIDFRDPGRRATKKRRVPVPISDRMFGTLTRVWIWQGRPKVGPVLGSFGSTRKGFAALTKLALPGRAITRHDLRRTWATLAAQRGVSMFDIAGVLGDTLPTVEKHYAVHAPGYLRNAINAR